ncbi:hypothetical protein LCGC14_2246600, partial [marine sediment metagenome]
MRASVAISILLMLPVFSCGQKKNHEMNTLKDNHQYTNELI